MAELTRSKHLAPWAHGALSVAGVALAISLLLPWVDVGWQSASGLTIARESKPWLFLVPLSGALLLAASATRSELTRLAAIFAGVVVVGSVMFHFTKGLLSGGVDSWLVFGGAAAMLAGVSDARRDWRVVGGLAVLVGFFAPWDAHSAWKTLTSEHLALLTEGFGVTVRVLWLIPVAGVLAIGSGVSPHPRAGRAALIAGLLVLGSIGWMLASLANAILGIGAWAALGASATALVLGVLAPAAPAASALVRR
jgi:hypothetical protein